MRGRVRFFLLALPGWVLLGTYLYYDYMEFGESFHDHIFSLTPIYSTFFHILIMTTPIVSIALAYFDMDRSKLISGLRRMELKYRDYYDNAPYGYHSADSGLEIIDVNRTWLSMIGYERGEVVGRMNMKDLLAPQSRKKLEKVYPGFRLSGRIDDLELDFLRKDGTVLPVLMSSTAVFEGGAFVRSRTIIKDNSERKTFEQILRGVAEHWEDTFNSMPWGVMILDERCNVLRFNEYFLTNGGLVPAEIAKTHCCGIIREPRSGDLEQHVYETEFHDSMRDRHFRISGRMIYSGELTRNYVFSVTDISDIRRGERKLVDSRNAFFNMLKDTSAAYRELDQAYSSMILSFANAIDAKSPWTKGHSERVSGYAVALGEAHGLDQKSLDRLRTAAILHDIGKIGTYDYLLEKTKGLTEEEYEVVKRHPAESARILRPIARFRDIVDIVKYHHEHYDGGGYPDGLKGEDIPMMARILALADSYDSMIADRPYRLAQDKRYAMEEIQRCAGRHFDPVLSGKFINLIKEGTV